MGSLSGKLHMLEGLFHADKQEPELKSACLPQFKTRGREGRGWGGSTDRHGFRFTARCPEPPGSQSGCIASPGEGRLTSYEFVQKNALTFSGKSVS